ncbi:MAG: hypothetical protein FWD55_04090, partial [Propionibacteriaceae bacterium]|nr:hypothetical protein [Propionibacteriaceae bacterium]
MHRRILALVAAVSVSFSALLGGTFAAQAADTTTISGKVNLPAGCNWSVDPTDPAPWLGDVGIVSVVDVGTDDAYFEEWTVVPINPDGTYSWDEALPGTDYLIYALSRDLNTPCALFGTYAGGFAMLSDVNFAHLANPDIVFSVDAAGTPLTGVDITMVPIEAYATGTVDIPSFSDVFVYVIEIDEWFNAVDATYANVDIDGTYSLPVKVGSTIIVDAWADDYLETWVGGYTGWTYDYSEPLITKIPILTPGETHIDGILTLIPELEDFGVSISGSVTLPNGVDWDVDPLDPSPWMGRVAIAPVTDLGTEYPFFEMTRRTDVKPDGTFSWPWAEPGKDYVVFVDPYDLALTSYDLLVSYPGGFSSMGGPALSALGNPASIVSIDAAGTSQAGIDITMIPAEAHIEGTVEPVGEDGANVAVCEPNEALTVFVDCGWIYVDDDGTFSVPVKVGATVVVSAYAPGYAYTWAGGATGWTEDVSTALFTKFEVKGPGVITIDEPIRLASAITISGAVTLPNGYSWVDDLGDPNANLGHVRIASVADAGTDSAHLDGRVTDMAWITPDGTYSWAGGIAGADYVVFVLPDELNITPSFAWTTFSNGSTITGYPQDWVLSDPGIIVSINAAGDSLENVNIEVAAPNALITGTVLWPQDSFASVITCEIDDSFEPSNCNSYGVDDDGSYVVPTTVGTTMVLCAFAEGYSYTWLGGAVGWDTDFSSDLVTKVPILTPGNTEVPDITLARTPFLSGTVVLPPGYDWDVDPDDEDPWYGWVYIMSVADADQENPYIDGDVFGLAWIESDGSYWWDEAEPGRDYVAFVRPMDLMISPTDYFGAFYGGQGMLYVPADAYLTNPNVIISMDADGTPITGLDIEIIPHQAWVEGTITPVVPMETWVWACTVDDALTMLVDCIGAYTDDDGNYSIPVLVGSTVVISAEAPGYLESWLGGAVGDVEDLSSPLVTTVSIPGPGVIPIDEIELVLGSTISGKIILPAGYEFDEDDYVEVLAIEVELDGDSFSLTYTGFSGICDSNGDFIIEGLAPGATYVVFAYPFGILPEGLIPTFYGQHATVFVSPDMEVNEAGMVPITLPPTRDDITGIDITMVAGVIVSGTVTSDSDWAAIQYCAITGVVYTDCQYAYADEDGQYYFVVDPDVTLVIAGWAPGYFISWAGGFISADENPNLPNPGILEFRVPGPNGTMTVDITLVEASSISGWVTLPGFYAPANFDILGYIMAAPIDYSGDTPVLGVPVWAEIDAAGFYFLEPLLPGGDYLVWVTRSGILVDDADFLTTGYGGWTSPYFEPTGIDLTNPDYVVHMPNNATRLDDIDIAMAQAAKLTGTVYLPDGTPSSTGYVSCYLIDPVEGLVWLEGAPVMEDGTYSCYAVPGEQHAFSVSVEGYPLVWAGGYVGDSPAVGDLDVATAGASGVSAHGLDIQLVAGSSVTGTVSGWQGADADADYFFWAMACRVVSNTITSDCGYAETFDDGTYTISGLAPTGTYVVYAGQGMWGAPGSSPSWYGGYVGSSPGLPNPGVTYVTFPLAGGGLDATGINIAVTAPVKFTGELLPAGLWIDATLWACPTYTVGGTIYYHTSTPEAAVAAIGAPANVDALCTAIQINPDATFSFTGQPGTSYAVVGQADGYPDSWNGGLAAASGIGGG